MRANERSAAIISRTRSGSRRRLPTGERDADLKRRRSTYTPEWQQTRHWTKEWSQRALFAAFAHYGLPTALLDVGCGDGHLVTTAARLGVPSVGVDISLPQKQRQGPSFVLIRADLTQPFRLEDYTRSTRGGAPSRFDFVLCWETAEHLPADAADVLVCTLATHTASGGVLLFTAAIPGQGGCGHVNEQPHEYWVSRLTRAGFRQCDGDALRMTWFAVCHRCPWYPYNLLAFRRG